MQFQNISHSFRGIASVKWYMYSLDLATEASVQTIDVLTKYSSSRGLLNIIAPSGFSCYSGWQIHFADLSWDQHYYNQDVCNTHQSQKSSAAQLDAQSIGITFIRKQIGFDLLPNEHAEGNVKLRIGATRTASIHIRSILWCWKKTALKIKHMDFRGEVQSVFLYDCQTWPL